MTSPTLAMKFFIDQNVPAAVGNFLQSSGHDVVLLRQRIPTESPDTLVAAVAEANNAILVTFDSENRSGKLESKRNGLGGAA